MNTQTFEEIDAPYNKKHHDETRARKIEILQHLDIYLLQGHRWTSVIDKIFKTKCFQDELTQEFINSLNDIDGNNDNGISTFTEVLQIFPEKYSEFINDDLEIYIMIKNGMTIASIIDYLRTKNTYNESKRLLLKIHALSEMKFPHYAMFDILIKTETNPKTIELLEKKDAQENHDISMLKELFPEHINDMLKDFMETGLSHGTITKMLALNF